MKKVGSGKKTPWTRYFGGEDWKGGGQTYIYEVYIFVIGALARIFP
jgi:hypothetical protein